jgi:preprotein translocase subunit SecE
VKIQDARQYLSDVRAEFNKITWPTQREYVGGTVGVVVIVAVMTLALGVIDLVLGALMRAVLP